MSCALTQDITLDCIDAAGGVKEVYFIELNNVSAITEASGVVTAITKASAKFFRKYQLPKETGNFTDTWTVSVENGTAYAAQTLTIAIIKLQATVRNEIMLLGKNNLITVVVDRNGTGWLLGRELGLNMTTGKGETGTKLGDKSGYTLDFAGNEKELAPTVNAATLLTLQTPG